MISLVGSLVPGAGRLGIIYRSEFPTSYIKSYVYNKKASHILYIMEKIKLKIVKDGHFDVF